MPPGCVFEVPADGAIEVSSRAAPATGVERAAAAEALLERVVDLVDQARPPAGRRARRRAARPPARGGRASTTSSPARRRAPAASPLMVSRRFEENRRDALVRPACRGRRECRAWETYYRRKWGACLVALGRLVRAAFGMSWPRTLVGAWLVLRANLDWAPYPDNDPEAARGLMRASPGYFARVTGGASTLSGRPCSRSSGGALIARRGTAAGRRDELVAPVTRPLRVRRTRPMLTMFTPRRGAPRRGDGHVGSLGSRPAVTSRRTRSSPMSAPCWCAPSLPCLLSCTALRRLVGSCRRRVLPEQRSPEVAAGSCPVPGPACARVLREAPSRAARHHVRPSDVFSLAASR